ncbi:hypothetical protein Hanom_Chr02g00141931 [Helianthus anomalus]
METRTNTQRAVDVIQVEDYYWVWRSDGTAGPSFFSPKVFSTKKIVLMAGYQNTIRPYF